MAYVHVISNLTSSLPQRATSTHRRKLTLSTLARRHGLDPRGQPLICSRNGQWISQKQWRRVCAKHDDVVTFVIMPRGGGLRVAAMLGILLAASVVAPFIAAPLAAALPAAFGGAVTALTTAGLVIGGSYLLNVLIPVKPAGDLSRSDLSSPTYANTLSAQNNIARLGAPIPVLYGRVRFVPDLAASPWVEWNEQHQILRQVFVLTQGEMSIEKVELGLTDLSSFEDVTTQIVGPGDPITLFPPEVFTSNQVSNIILTPPNDPDVVPDRGQWASTTTYALNDIVYQDVYTGGTGPTRRYFKSLSGSNINHFPSSSPSFWQNVGSAPPGTLTLKGPFPACPPGRTISKIGVDLSFPAGLFILDPTTGAPLPATIQWRFDCQEITDSGDPVGNWIFLDAETADSTFGQLVTPVFPQSQYMGAGYQYVAQRTSPITISFRITLPHAARWQIRARRATDKNLTGTVGHDIAWTGLRGFIENSRAYGDCTMLAIEIRNTKSSSVNDQSAHQVAVTGTRSLPWWDGSVWRDPLPTENIEWAVADMLRNTTYGGKRDNADFDLAHLLELGLVWADRGDTFNYYAAQPLTLWATLSMALRAGRTVPYHQSGIVRFHRDAPQTVPTMLFSAENIVKGSLQMNFLTPSPEDETDSLQVDYLNSLDWLQESILLPKAGVSDPVVPSINKLDGVTDTDQAQREAEYMLAADRYRRVLLSWDTELEGLIASRGDLVLVQHDMPRWGQSTRVYDWDPATNTVTLWGRLDFGDRTEVWAVYFRDRRGRPSSPVNIAMNFDTFVPLLKYDEDALTIALTRAPLYYDGSAFDMTATRAEPLHMVVGKSTAVPRQVIFLGASPRGGKTVSITAVLEDSRVHVN